MVKKRDATEHVTLAEEIVICASDFPELEQENQEDSQYQSLLKSAQKIRKNENILGYILRGESQATVDLVEPTKIIEYAMMASQAIESSEIMADSFNLGKIENIIVEGKNAKMLCINLGQNKLSVFMEKTADPNWLLEMVSPDEGLLS